MNKKILFLILAIGLIIRVIISFSIEFSITHGISSDDSYYYFRIAQNIVQGYGSTFDQINPTNGYQPLVLWFLVLIYKIFGSDILTPIIVSQVILSFVATLATYLTFLFIKKMSNDDFAASITVLFIFLNPVVIAINFKSLEINFYWLFLIASLLFYENYLKNSSNLISDSRYFLFGLIIALAALSRLDGGFYILALAFYFLFFRKDDWLIKVRKIFLIGSGFSILLLPYLLYNFYNFGNPVPISGRAKIFHNHKAIMSQLGNYFSFDFFLYEIRRFIFPFNFDLFSERGFGLFEQVAVYIIIAITFLVIIIFLKYGYFKKSIELWKGYGFVPIYLLLHYSFYTLYFWEYRFYYFFPEFLVVSIFLWGILSNLIKDKFRTNIQKARTFLFILVVFVFVLGGIKMFTARHGQILAYKTALWIKDNLPKEKIYSAANAGILSYFSQFRFINLDGMVNNDELLNAYRGGEEDYFDYLKKKNINYLVDYFLDKKPENKYYFPKILNDKYEIVKVFTDKRLKYHKLNHVLVIKLNL